MYAWTSINAEDEEVAARYRDKEDALNPVSPSLSYDAPYPEEARSPPVTANYTTYYNEAPKKKVDAIACAEVGGSNSMAPLEAGALTNKPVVDGDAMGRAFPEMQMSTLFINGVASAPAAMVDEKGNSIIFGQITDSFALEKFARDLCIQMGCVSLLAAPVMTGAQVKAHAVPRTRQAGPR